MAGNELPQGTPVDPIADPHREGPHDAPHHAPHTAAEERAQWRALQGDVEGLADVAAERGRGLLDAPAVRWGTPPKGVAVPRSAASAKSKTQSHAGARPIVVDPERPAW